MSEVNNERVIKLAEKIRDKAIKDYGDTLELNELISLLEAKPPAGELTTKIRFELAYRECAGVNNLFDEDVFELCSRHDTAEQRIKELEKMDELYSKLNTNRLVLEAELVTVKNALKQKTHLLENKS